MDTVTFFPSFVRIANTLPHTPGALVGGSSYGVDMVVQRTPVRSPGGENTTTDGGQMTDQIVRHRMDADQPAGWYPDPDGSADARWWDGTGWTDQFTPDQMAVDYDDEPESEQSPAVGTEPAGGVHRVMRVATFGIGASVVALGSGVFAVLGS